MNVLEHHIPVGRTASSGGGGIVAGDEGEAVTGGWLKQVLAGVRAERLARRVEAVRAAGGASVSKFGCLMAQLPSLDSELPNWAADNIKSGTLAEEGIETETHCTVLYGFNLDFDSSKLKQEYGGITLKLGKVSRFECPEYDVLKLAVESPDLVALNERLMREFGNEVTSSKWAYNPHVTIAYVKKGTNKYLDGNKTFEGREIRVRQLLYSLPEKQGRVVIEASGTRQYNAVRAATDTRNVAKAVVKDEDGSVLLIRDVHYGSWDLPGGHLEEGESYEDELRREVREETGLSLISETRREDHDKAIIYDATVAGRKPHVTLSDEHDDYKWVQEGKAKHLATFWLGGYEGHEAVRNEAQATISRAVSRVVLLAEANAVARKQDDEFLDYATLIMAAALAAAYGKAAKDLANLATGEDRGESLTHNEEVAYAKGRQNVLDGFLDNVRERLSSEKGRGASLGETDTELAERVRKTGEEVIAGSGKVVAETEAQAIYGHAQFRALKRAGYTSAFWVTVGDERVRDSHTACEAAGAVKIGHKFPNGLLFPGDSVNGGPEEVCNCRCVLEGASKR